MRMRLSFIYLPLVLASKASAVVVASYTFLDGNITSGDGHAGTVAGNFSLSGGTAAGTDPQSGFSSSTDQPYIRTLSLTSSKVSAIAEDDYFAFTLTPDTGGQVPLSQLRFSFGGSNLSNGSAPGDDYTAFVAVQAQVGSGAFFDVGSPISRAVPYIANSEPQLDPFSIDLAGVPELQNATEAVTFHFYLYSSVSHDGKIVRMDNVVLDTVPEPSMALLAVAGGALALGRRRSRA